MTVDAMVNLLTVAMLVLAGGLAVVGRRRR